MAEYIERDEAIRKALEACVMVVGHGISQIYAVDIVDVMEGIPTADVVPVVRCKDCKHKETLTDSMNKKISTVCLLGEALHFVEDNHYCSYGERRCE